MMFRCLALLALSGVSPGAPEIRIVSSEPALRAGEAFYTDQEVTVRFSVERAWGRGYSGVILGPGGSISSAKFAESGLGSYIIKAGEWTRLVDHPNDRSFVPFTARLLEDLVDEKGDPRRDAGGAVLQRTVLEKKFLIIRRRSPIRGAIRIDPTDVFYEGEVARVRVVLGEGAFANKTEPVDYRLVLVRLSAAVSELVSAERAVKLPVREPGEDSFDTGTKEEWPILSADWNPEIKLATAPGAYELRVRDASGWIYDRKRLTVVFPSPRLSEIMISSDPVGSELLGEEVFAVSVRIEGSAAATLVRSEGASRHALEA